MNKSQEAVKLATEIMFQLRDGVSEEVIISKIADKYNYTRDQAQTLVEQAKMMM